MKLQRTLEPEVMDSPQDAKEYNRMDHSTVNRLFVSDLLAYASQVLGKSNGDDWRLGDVLDLGTGTALIPVELCRQHAHCRIMAIDMAISMLDLAVYNVEGAGLAERITLCHADAKCMNYSDGMFHVVMSNSIIHHIPQPMACLMEMVRVTEAAALSAGRFMGRGDKVAADRAASRSSAR